MTSTAPSILALDLEGTLISNAMSQIPRPGLCEFLSTCRELFPRVVIFTTVKETRFREIARLLVEENLAPRWFAEIVYISRQGETKDFGFIPGANPATSFLWTTSKSTFTPVKKLSGCGPTTSISHTTPAIPVSGR